MLNFKINVRITKILLALVIITFFLPFFAVSCSSRDSGVNISAFEISAGKSVGEYKHKGEPLGFILVIPAAGLLIASVYAYDVKNAALYNIYKTALFIAPVFNIFAAAVIKRAAEAAVMKKIYAEIARFSDLSPEAVYSSVNIRFNIKYGFVFYILLSAALFVFAAINYFLKREEPTKI